MTANEPTATEPVESLDPNNAPAGDPVDPKPTPREALEDAARDGDLGRVREILDACGDGLAEADPVHAMPYAAARGRLDCLKLLLPLCLGREAMGSRALALCWAAKYNQPACLPLLLTACDPRVPLHRSTALMCAAKYGSPECLRALLPVSDAHATNNQGQTALILAAQAGHLACVELLLPHSDAKHFDCYGLTALMHAAKNAGKPGGVDVLRALLPASDALARAQGGRLCDNGEGFCRGLHTGATALILAAQAENHGAARLSDRAAQLLLPLSDPKVSTDEGETALMAAAANCRARTIQKLLPLSEPNAQDHKGWTALMHAVSLFSRGCSRGAVRSLRRVSDLTLRNHEGDDALSLAVARESFWLQECPGDPRGSDWPSHTVRALLPKGALRAGRANALLPSIERAMFMAAAGGDTASARELLPFCAPLARDSRGRTFLMRAAASACPPLVRLLLPLSDAQAVDDRGISAIARAASAKDTYPRTEAEADECVEILAPFSSTADVARVVAQLGRERVPLCAAQIEARTLREAIRQPQSEPVRSVPARSPRRV